jgi:iron complex transport system permease protein
LRGQLFFAASALAATSVVLAGPIGFVGLVAPHVARLTVGPSHRQWIIGATMLGGILLLTADGSVQLIQHWKFIPQPRGLWPVGMLTSLIGGPMFLVLLRRQAHVRSGPWTS